VRVILTSKEPSEPEWIYLFDGTSTDGWRAYNGEALPPQWIIVDSCLTFTTDPNWKRNM
jgi:hypothetical protein